MDNCMTSSWVCSISLGWRFGDQRGIIWGEEECDGVVAVGEDQWLQGCL